MSGKKFIVELEKIFSENNAKNFVWKFRSVNEKS